MASNRTRRTSKKDWAPDFLEAFERLGMVVAACDLIGIGRRTAYDRREKDEEFRQAWDDVAERSTERMEAEAFRRAVEGIDKPIYHQGERVDTVREYSDTLLIFMLKSRRPGTYREHHRIEHVGRKDEPVHIDVSSDIAKAAHLFLENVRREQENEG